MLSEGVFYIIIYFSIYKRNHIEILKKNVIDGECQVVNSGSYGDKDDRGHGWGMGLDDKKILCYSTFNLLKSEIFEFKDIYSDSIFIFEFCSEGFLKRENY